MSDAIMQALRMPREERIERWQRMMDIITREDIAWWRHEFTQALMTVPLEIEQRETARADGVKVSFGEGAVP
jgi:trehalose 6-phosphate synthase